MLREAVARAFEFGDVRNSETELRLRAHKLAGLISEIEVTMLQTEDMLAEESRCDQDVLFEEQKWSRRMGGQERLVGSVILRLCNLKPFLSSEQDATGSREGAFRTRKHVCTPRVRA